MGIYIQRISHWHIKNNTNEKDFILLPFYDIATRRIYGKNIENNYINPLPNNIKALPEWVWK